MTLVEIAVAVAIFALIVIFMSTMMARSLDTILHGKQRSHATNESERILELARNVPFDALGHNSSDTFNPADEPGLILSGATYRYQTDSPCGSSEPLSFVTAPGALEFGTHVQSGVDVGSTTLTRYVYVTDVDEGCNGTVDAKRVIVRSVWANPGDAGAANEVRVQTIVSRTQSLPTAIPPLSGLAQAQAGLTTITVAEGTDTLGNPTARSVLDLSRSTGQTKVVQITRVECVSSQPQIQGGASAGPPAQVTVDDDPNSAAIPLGPQSDTRTGSLGVESPFTGSPAATGATCAADAITDRSASPPDFPTGDGTASMNSAISYGYPASGLPPLLALPSTITAFSVASSVARTDVDHSEITVGDPTSRQVDFEARSDLGEVTILGGSATDPVSGALLDFSSGLLRITPTTISSSAFANGGNGCTLPLPDEGCSGDADAAVGSGFDIFVFKPNASIVGCDDPFAGANGNYCRFEVRNSNIADLTGKELSESITDPTFAVNYSVTVTLDGPKSSPSSTTPGGEIYERRFQPVASTVSLTLRDPVTLADAVQLQIDFTVGDVLARACHGIASGAVGCL